MISKLCNAWDMMFWKRFFHWKNLKIFWALKCCLDGGPFVKDGQHLGRRERACNFPLNEYGKEGISINIHQLYIYIYICISFWSRNSVPSWVVSTHSLTRQSDLHDRKFSPSDWYGLRKYACSKCPNMIHHSTREFYTTFCPYVQQVYQPGIYALHLHIPRDHQVLLLLPCRVSAHPGRPNKLNTAEAMAAAPRKFPIFFSIERAPDVHDA